MRRRLFAVLLATACTGDLDEHEDGADHAEDRIDVFEGEALVEELTFSPEHQALEPFRMLEVLYEGPEGVALEVSTVTADGTWTEWTLLDGARIEEAYVADVAVAAPGAEPATGYRLRGVVDAAAPTYVAVAPVGSDTEALDESSDGFSSTTSELDNFTIFRYDLGRVSRPWLWLLRTARRHGWTGRLLGTRTGLRTYQEQLQLWNAYQNGTGSPAFPPWGPSRHLIRNVREHGRWYQAIDTQDVSRLIQIARNHGVRLHRPYSNEPWHVEAVEKFTAPSGWNP
jgi:hypothetical protein